MTGLFRVFSDAHDRVLLITGVSAQTLVAMLHGSLKNKQIHFKFTVLERIQFSPEGSDSQIARQNFRKHNRRVPYDLLRLLIAIH
jgi:hypothetical protein